jgi:hypothetical protein
MKRLPLCTLLTLAIAMGTSAASASAEPLTNSASGGLEYVAKGEGLTLRLAPANSGSSGYHWRVASKRSRAVLPLRASYAGVGGRRQVLEFSARRVGLARLKLQYVPPGRHRKVVKTFRLDVVVNPAEPKLNCTPGRARTIVDNGVAQAFALRRSALVYTQSQNYLRSVAYDAYYGCDYSRDTAYPLLPRGAEPAFDELYNLTLNGTTLGYVVQTGCPFKYEGGCSGPDAPRVESVDLHAGTLVRSASVSRCSLRPDCFARVTGLVVSPAGGLAWIESGRDDDPVTVHRSDRPAQPGEAAASDDDVIGDGEPGDVDPLSLHYDGTEFSYVRGGEVHRAPLR